MRRSARARLPKMSPWVTTGIPVQDGIDGRHGTGQIGQFEVCTQPIRFASHMERFAVTDLPKVRPGGRGNDARRSRSRPISWGRQNGPGTRAHANLFLCVAAARGSRFLKRGR